MFKDFSPILSNMQSNKKRIKFQGDSGGPLIVQRHDKRMEIVGIVSWGNNNNFFFSNCFFPNINFHEIHCVFRNWLWTGRFPRCIHTRHKISKLDSAKYTRCLLLPKLMYILWRLKRRYSLN